MSFFKAEGPARVVTARMAGPQVPVFKAGGGLRILCCKPPLGIGL